MERKPSLPFLLISTFADVWSDEYAGEIYEKSRKDFRLAKLYLEHNDFRPDVIVSRAKTYLLKDGFYAENRHSFSAFINNIGSFVPPKQRRELRKTWTCPHCQETMPEAREHHHDCPKLEQHPERVAEMVDGLKKLMGKEKL